METQQNNCTARRVGGTQINFSTYLVGVLSSVTVNTVVGSVQATFQEPGNVTVFKATRLNCSKVLVPSKKFTGKVAKELGRVRNGLFVHFLVMIIAIDMWLRRVFAKVKN